MMFGWFHRVYFEKHVHHIDFSVRIFCCSVSSRDDVLIVLHLLLLLLVPLLLRLLCVWKNGAHLEQQQQHWKYCVLIHLPHANTRYLLRDDSRGRQNKKKIEEKVGCFLTCCYDALPMKQAKWHVIIIVYLRAIWYSGWSAVIHECMHYLFTRYNMMLSYMCACPCVLAGGCWDAKVCLLDTIGRSHLLTLYAYERPLSVLFIQFVCLLRTLNLH